jgi:transaldolase
MSEGYFHRVTRETPTRFWVNNPTVADADRAIAAGAISCTTNPTYCANMLKSKTDREDALNVIDSVIREVSDDDQAAAMVQHRLAKRIMDKFLPLYERNPGREGVVSIQDDPHADEDVDRIIHEALRFRQLSQNFITKIPCTDAGLRAFEVLIQEDMPIIATEVFAMAQAEEVCELYQRVSNQCGKHPPFYVTHITGIFDEYLGKYVEREGIEIAPEVLREAGCAVARKQYRMMRERRYPITMLGGGARGLHHFTEMVGGHIHVTINWSTAEELLALNPPVVNRMDATVPQEVIDELCDKLPDFRRAWFEDGLKREEFADFGPLQLFRNNFIRGWDTLLDAIRERRRALVESAAARP